MTDSQPRLFSDMMLVMFATAQFPLISCPFSEPGSPVLLLPVRTIQFTSINSFSTRDGEGQILLLAMKSPDSQTYQNLHTFTPALIAITIHLAIISKDLQSS